MSFVVGAAVFMGVGVVLGSWYFDAHRRWLDALAGHGELAMGGTELLTRGWRRPRDASATLTGIARLAYPRASHSPHLDVELWRMRRQRRLVLFVGWILTGGPIAVVIMAAIDLAHSLWWLLVLIPMSVAVALGGMAAYRFGEFQPRGEPRKVTNRTDPPDSGGR